jgi:hypothetical protein
MITVFDLVNPYLPDWLGNYTAGLGPAPTLAIYIRNLINVAFGFGGVYFFINLMMGGYQYISAGGDKDSVQKATARIKNAIIGIAILLSIFVIIWIVETIFGAPIREVNVPDLYLP